MKPIEKLSRTEWFPKVLSAGEKLSSGALRTSSRPSSRQRATPPQP